MTPAEALQRLDMALDAAERALTANDLDALAAAARAKQAMVDALAHAPPDDLPRDEVAACAARVRALGRAIAARRAQVDRRLWALARATGRGVPIYGADGRMGPALTSRA